MWPRAISGLWASDGRLCLSVGPAGRLCRFWLAVQDLKQRPLLEVAERTQEIWAEFLAEGAPSTINLDSHSYERTGHNLKDPGRYSYEDAQVGLTGGSCLKETPRLDLVGRDSDAAGLRRSAVDPDPTFKHVGYRNIYADMN